MDGGIIREAIYKNREVYLATTNTQWPGEVRAAKTNWSKHPIASLASGHDSAAVLEAPGEQGGISVTPTVFPRPSGLFTAVSPEDWPSEEDF